MTSYTWILLLLSSLVGTREQGRGREGEHARHVKIVHLQCEQPPFSQRDRSEKRVKDYASGKPKEKPAPPKISDDSGFDLSDVFDLDLKKPVVVPPKSEDGLFDLSDAFGPDTEHKKHVVPPKESGSEGRGAQGGEETPSPESAAAVVCLKEPSTSASRTHCMGGSGRVLTDGVPETQRDTTDALKVIADELKKISVVLCDIASTLKVKK
ncbi:uncharacterized protein LOC128021224 [Carassius gibelio]|uniref:uncharacterized protein LOC128021224 n=1 Tax=Carassius gibelio TaxID=101364 RepID=UPI00227747B0|nr:uncharacterized protein LOC128021224 [Carassius gibelio]